MRSGFSNDKLEKFLAQAEQTFNLVGYIPIISIASASVRSFGGIVQAITGTGLAIGIFCMLGFTKSRQIKHFVRLKISLAHIAHGVCNILRAKIEAVPFLSLLICLPYDRLFNKRFRYAIEVYPDEIPS